MKFLIVATSFFLACVASRAIAAYDNGYRKMKIGLMTASLPWHFGPYQSQMHKLSLILSELKDDGGIEYDVYWMHYADPWVGIGVYNTYEELRPHIANSVPPPVGFPLGHLKFLGVSWQTMEGGQMSAKTLNTIQKEYDLDCLITLMDITKLVPDEPFNMPVLAWIPLHSERVSAATPDYWVLRTYHGIAGLAPSSAKAIENAVGKNVELTDELGDTRKTLNKIFGSVQVDFIPHIFDRKAIMASANVGLSLLEEYSAAETDAKLTNTALVNRGQESTLEPDHPRYIFGKARENDFVVLLQGGNYESEDRKGWDSSLQAFARFYNSLDDPSGVHLLIHSMESYLIAADNNNDLDAPGYILPKGVMLHFALHDHDLPRDAYTIDIAKHSPEVVAAYKKRADVCLHPSKVEGFGMNVIECQVVGTPVITTNYTAMRDFTKLGRSVPPRQMIRSPQYIYNMALPDVNGIADALKELYDEHLAIKRRKKEVMARREKEILQFNEWIDKTCSPEIVGEKFRALMLRSISEFNDRDAGKQVLFSGDAPSAGAYKIASGYHSTIVDWDAPWTLFAPDGLQLVDPQKLHRIAWMVLLQGSEIPAVMIIPAKYEDGSDVPFKNMEGDGIHDDLPILVRSFIVTAFQGRMSRRKSLVHSAIQHSGEPRIIPAGLAIIERKKAFDTSSRQHFGDEL